jgi:hypothetical protein
VAGGRGGWIMPTRSKIILMEKLGNVTAGNSYVPDEEK